MAATTLDFVTYYQKRGWYLFPVKADKKPIFPAAHEKGNPCKGECGQLGHGFHDATNDMFTLSEWWSKYPTAGIGVATGIKSGFFALDVDVRHGGDKTLADLETKYGPLPATPINKTGGGGFHHLFIYPHGFDIKNSAGKLGDGLDTRGEGGYIVVPPSPHESGKCYEWDKDHAPSKTELANCPTWLFDLITAKSEPQYQNVTTPATGAYISGQRNNALISLAGTMRRRGMSEDAIFSALSAENNNRCVPPLTEGEVRGIAASVVRYQPQAALPMESKDRVTAEWAFCKTLYRCPDFITEHSRISPEMLSDAKLREYWTKVQAGVSMGQAATECGILTDLEKYDAWDLPHLSDYAGAIEKFSYLSKVRSFGAQLQSAAESGDTSRIDRAILDLNKNIDLPSKRITAISDVADEVEAEVREREKNPVDVWGIPYAFPYLSSLTGGKQPGELIILAGEPKVGKSWWAYQDALETAIHDTPVYVWSGEMKRRQVMRRMYQLLGVNGRNMRTGKMTEQDWDAMTEARALILNSPLYIDDQPMRLGDLRSILLHEQMEHGIKQFIIDYAFLVDAPGKDEIERTSNVSRALKNIVSELDLSGLLITSVTKAGMDTNSENAAKSNIRGSGQQIHDADIVYILTKFSPASDDPVQLQYKPSEHELLATLHIAAGRELDHTLPKGVLHYKRINGTPKFEEVSKPKKETK